MTYPKTRLIIPTSGKDTELARLLASMDKFGFFNKSWLETAVVDNCQDEAASDEVNLLLDNYPTIIRLREGEKGKAYAVNQAIAKTNAEFVAFLDDDTVIITDNHLEIMLDHFNSNPNLGYVSGRVLGINDGSTAELWEKKGGLSKGEAVKYWNYGYLASKEFKIKPWQFNKMCAGANSIIRREVLLKGGPFHILLEGHDGFKAGATIQIGHRVVRSGYELLYDPSAVVGHKHPTNQKEIRQKLFNYGQADTAYQVANFLMYNDLRCLLWSLVGHPYYTISQKIIPSIFGKYPLSVYDLLYGLSGNILGGPKYMYVYFLKKGQNKLYEYESYWRQIAYDYDK